VERFPQSRQCAAGRRLAQMQTFACAGDALLNEESVQGYQQIQIQTAEIHAVPLDRPQRCFRPNASMILDCLPLISRDCAAILRLQGRDAGLLGDGFSRGRALTPLGTKYIYLLNSKAVAAGVDTATPVPEDCTSPLTA
jgi:hypothetical protein